MANELKIRVVFDTGQAKAEAEKFTSVTKDLENAQKSLDAQILSGVKAKEADALAMQKQWNAAEKLVEKFNNFEARQRGVVDSTNQLSKGSANAAMTLQALNYTIRDSPYFFRDFSLGLLAIGNNLNPLIDGMIRMKQESGGLFKGLMSSLGGTNGLIFGFSVLVSAIQAVTFALAKNNAEGKKMSEESLSDLIEKYKTLTEKIRDANDELGKLRAGDTTAAYRAITEELTTLTKKLDELIKKQEYYNQINKMGVGTSGQSGYASIASVLFGPSDKEKKETEDAIKKDQARLEEIRRLMAMLDLAQASYMEGNIKGFAKNLSDKDLEFISQTFRSLSKEVIPGTSKAFDVLDGQIVTTKDDAVNLANAIDEVLNPKKERAKKPGLGSGWDLMLDELDAKIEDFKERIAAEKKLKETEFNMAKETSSFNNKISDYISKSDNEDQKKKQKKLEDEIEEDMKRLNKEMSNAKSIADELATSLIHAFSSGKNFLDSFLVSLEATLVKMLAMLAIEQLIASIFGGGLPIAPALPGLVGGSVLGKPLMTPISSIVGGSNFQNIGLQKSMNAMNMNMVSGQPTILIQSSVPGLEFTKKIINPSQAKLLKGNIINVS